MTGLLERIGKVFRGSQPVAADRLDPDRQAVEARAAQTETLQQIRRGIARVAEIRRGLSSRLGALVTEMDRATLRARQALLQGRVELATEVLRHKAALGSQLGEFDMLHDRLQLVEERLVLASGRMQARLDTLHAQRAGELSEQTRVELDAQINAALAELDADVTTAVSAAVEMAGAVALDGAAPQASAWELDRRAAEELAAMQAEQLARSVTDPATTRYRQPSVDGVATSQDSFCAETSLGDR